ncbi:folate synthesis bifunctional protein, mitochondrial isoform X2 [Salvia divinorum]|uniref:dihydropteroate synthase n=1 Tax=Salvia divinorum TaxID=28513 RepID=A0ABD1H3Z8_SALDI
MGKFLSVESAVSRVRSMLAEGADIVDLGAQSTRPMASKQSPEQELDRLIPVLEAVRDMPEMEGKLISVDTFHSQVALEAVGKGAHLVNDVSGGKLDAKMHHVVASLGIPYIVMHMRGDPSTMQNRENLVYDDVCSDVASALCTRVRDAELSGVPAWKMIVDPGIGFSKNTEKNLDILMGLPAIRSEIGKKSLALAHATLLVGPSRKRFLGEVCGRPVAGERDPATVAAVTAAVLSGANILPAFLPNPRRVLLPSPLFLHATSAVYNLDDVDEASDESNGEVELIDSWEEEDEAEPEVWFDDVCYLAGQLKIT